jgi:hypothetical protein
MSTKSALKAVRIALDSRDFEDAAEKAKAVVKQDPQNYHAYVMTKLCYFDLELISIYDQKRLPGPSTG